MAENPHGEAVQGATKSYDLRIMMPWVYQFDWLMGLAVLFISHEKQRKAKYYWKRWIHWPFHHFVFLCHLWLDLMGFASYRHYLLTSKIYKWGFKDMGKEFLGMSFLVGCKRSKGVAPTDHPWDFNLSLWKL